MIDAFVINLDRQIDNFYRVKDSMETLGGFEVQRVSAVDGKRDHMQTACDSYCPDSARAIALSHKKVAKMVHDSDKEIVLVLEDDATPIDDGTFHDKLRAAIAEAPKDWDMILLYCGSACPKDSVDTTIFTGSTAAYLMSRSGAKKLMDMPVYHQVDMQTSMMPSIKKYKSRENLFVTDESESTNRTTRTSLTEWPKILLLTPFLGYDTSSRVLKYKFIKLFGITLTVNQIIDVVFAIILLGYIIWSNQNVIYSTLCMQYWVYI